MSTTRLTLGAIVIAGLDTLLIALYVELTDRIIPSRGMPRGGPGRRAEVTDAELVCLAVAQVLLRYDERAPALAARRAGPGGTPVPAGCWAEASTTTGSRAPRR